MKHMLATSLHPRFVVFGLAGVALATAQPALGQMFEQPYEPVTAHIGHDSSVIVDVDGDGDEDIIVGGVRIAVLWNDGTGSYTYQEIAFDGPDFSLQVDAGDLDADGDVDLFVANQSFPEEGPAWWGVFRNNGDQTFTAPELEGYPYAAFGPVRLADVDGDEDLDVIIADGGLLGNTFTIYRNDGSANFVQGGTYPLGPGSLQSVDVGDIDGDGDPDVISGHFNGGDPANVAIARNNGEGSYAAPQLLTLPGPEANSVRLADLDADDDRDLLVVDPDSDWVIVYENDGSGTFTASSIVPTVGLAWDVAVGDLDGDGDADLAVSGDIDFGIFDHAEVWVHFNEGDGTFITGDEMYEVGDFAFWIGMSDVDQDGDQDILAAAGGSDDFFALLRHIDTECDLDGDGVIGFTDLTVLLGAWGACPASCPADLDGDGSVGFTDLTTLLGSWGRCL